jgi:hypothetical protein
MLSFEKKRKQFFFVFAVILYMVSRSLKCVDACSISQQ